MYHNNKHIQEIEDRARVQIELIEQIHSVEILNKERIVRLIAETTGDTRQVLMICTRLNTWIAGTGSREDLIVPDEVIQYLLKNNIEVSEPDSR